MANIVDIKMEKSFIFAISLWSRRQFDEFQNLFGLISLAISSMKTKIHDKIRKTSRNRCT